MISYKIITDSACDLTKKQLEALDISCVDLRVDIPGSDVHIIGESDEEVKGFFNQMRDGVAITTSAANMGEMQALMEPILQEGYDVLYLGFDSSISSTYQNCDMGAQELKEKYPERKIYTLDTLCASLGFGLLVTLVGEKRLAGASIEEVYEYAKSLIPITCHWFTVDDLVYLKRGGRVSATTAAVGTILNIKPVLHCDNEGKLTAAGKVRGRRKALEAMVQKVVEGAFNPAEQHMMICHGDCYDDALWVKNQLIAKLGVKQVDIGYIGPVIGAHAGPGTIGMFYLGNNR